MKILRKGISKDKSFIALEYQCENGNDTWVERFHIYEENSLFLGYGYCVRTPDFYVRIKGVKYACFLADGKTIKLPNKCYAVIE